MNIFKLESINCDNVPNKSFLSIDFNSLIRQGLPEQNPLKDFTVPLPLGQEFSETLGFQLALRTWVWLNVFRMQGTHFPPDPSC